jgi:hypothetical protein
MNKSGFIFFCVALFLISFSKTNADPFSGSFTGYLEGERYDLVLRKKNDSYQGTIQVGYDQIPLSAALYGNQLKGQLGQFEEIFEFFAVIQNDGSLYLEDEDGEVIVFKPNTSKSSGSAAANNSQSQAGERQVFINRIRLDASSLNAIESDGQFPIADGRYWYDFNSGAWGVEGGPTAGFIYPGLSLPGPMPVNISGGGTGIYINGREIHPLEQQALYQLFGVTYQGNFWMDALGNLGYVGGPAIANVLQASQAAQGGSSLGGDSGGGSVTHGYDSTYGARGTVSGGMYSGRTASGKSVFWYPGM